MMPARGLHAGESDEVDPLDIECLRLINEYFYGVRIFPGQDPGHVYVGWVTTQFHLQDKVFDQSKDRKVVIARVDDAERTVERYIPLLLSLIEYIPWYILFSLNDSFENAQRGPP